MLKKQRTPTERPWNVEGAVESKEKQLRCLFLSFAEDRPWLQERRESFFAKLLFDPTLCLVAEF